jgi:hypothetical protein
VQRVQQKGVDMKASWSLDHWSEKGNIEVFGLDEYNSSGIADDDVFKEEHDVLMEE